MKVTLSELDNMEDTLWEGEALTASWDSDRSEFVIRGDMDNRALNI